MKRIQFISSLFIVPFIPIKGLVAPFIWKESDLYNGRYLSRDGIEYQIGITNSHIWFVRFGENINKGFEWYNTPTCRKQFIDYLNNCKYTPL